MKYSHHCRNASDPKHQKTARANPAAERLSLQNPVVVDRLRVRDERLIDLLDGVVTTENTA